MSLPKSTWPTTTVGSLCDQIRGVSYSKGDARNEPDNGLVPILRANNIHNDGMLAFDDLIYVPRSVVAATQYIREHDIVIAASSGSLSVVGKAAQARSDWSGGFGAFCKVLRPNTKVEPRYLAYFFRTEHYRHRISQLAAGANINNLRNEHLDDLEIPLPPLSEQKRIADILDKADAIRRKRQEALQLNGDVIYSVYQEQFGNPIANPNGFPTRKIDDMCNLVRGSSPRPKSDPRYYGGPIRRLMVEDITRDGRLVTPQIDSLTEEGAKKSRPCTAGTVVMVVSGNVGLPAKLAVDACIHDGFVGLQDLDTSVIRPDFLVLTLEMLKVTHERFKAGAIWQNLTTHQIKAMEIPLPPLDEQDDFDQFVARHNQFTTVLKAKASEEDRLFNSLVQRAFKGEL